MTRQTEHKPAKKPAPTGKKTSQASDALIDDVTLSAPPAHSVLGMQRLIGNRATQRMLSRSAAQRMPGQSTPDIQQAPGDDIADEKLPENQPDEQNQSFDTPPAAGAGGAGDAGGNVDGGKNYTDPADYPQNENGADAAGGNVDGGKNYTDPADYPQNENGADAAGGNVDGGKNYTDPADYPQNENGADAAGGDVDGGKNYTDPADYPQNENGADAAGGDVDGGTDAADGDVSAGGADAAGGETDAGDSTAVPQNENANAGGAGGQNGAVNTPNGQNPPANGGVPPAAGTDGAGGAPNAVSDGAGGAGGNGLIDKELAENKRATTTPAQDPKALAEQAAGGSWSLDRLGFVAQNVGAGAWEGGKTGAMMGAATGVATRMAERGALWATQKWGPKILSNVAKATPVPAVGAIIGGGLAVYSLANKWKDRENIYKTITNFGQGEDVFDVIANSLDSISQVIDIVSASLNVIAGIAGLFAAGAWLAAVLSAGTLTPLAGAATALAAGIGVATTVLDLVNLGIGSLILAFRSLHMMNKDFESPEAVVKAGQDLQKAASGPFAAAGAFAGGKAAGRGKKSKESFEKEIAAAPKSKADVPPASQGPQLTVNVPTSTTPPADANAAAPSALPVDVPTPASKPDLPTPASQPDLPTPASKPDLPTPASQPDLPTPASQPDTPTPASAPDIPTSQQTGVQNPDGGGVFTGAENSRRRNQAREDFKQITEQDIDAMLDVALNPANPQISAVEAPVPQGHVGTPRELPNYTEKDVDTMLNNAFDPQHPDSILVNNTPDVPPPPPASPAQNVADLPLPPPATPAQNVADLPPPPLSPAANVPDAPAANTSQNTPDAPAANPPQNTPDAPATTTTTVPDATAPPAAPPPPAAEKKPWIMTPERVAAHQKTNEKWQNRSERLSALVGKGKDSQIPLLGPIIRYIASTSVDGAPAGFGANTPAGQHAGFNLDEQFAEEAAEQEKKSVSLPVQPAYTPPPATPQDVQTLNEEASALGQEKQAAVEAERHATAQVRTAEENAGPLEEAIDSTDEGLQNASEHSQEVQEGAQKNEEKGTKLEEVDSEVTGSEDAFSQLQPFISLIRGFLRYTYLASYLPDGAEATVNSAADDARNIVDNIESAKAKVDETKTEGPAQKAKVTGDAQTLDEVSSQNTDTAKQFEEAKADYEQSQSENDQMKSTAQDVKDKASNQRGQISEQKASTEAEAVETQAAIDQWAAEQAAIRAQALQNAALQAQMQGFEVTGVQDIP
jgi:hypothetical protein